MKNEKKKKTKKVLKDTRIGVRLSHSEKTLLDTYCKKHVVKKSTVVRDSLLAVIGK